MPGRMTDGEMRVRWCRRWCRMPAAANAPKFGPDEAFHSMAEETERARAEEERLAKKNAEQAATIRALFEAMEAVRACVPLGELSEEAKEKRLAALRLAGRLP